MVVRNSRQISNPQRSGQNFLTDDAILQRIVDHAVLREDETALEVGAGTGNLTALIRQYASRVIAVEKDRRLVNTLRKRFQRNDNVEIIEGDILKIPLPAFDKVVASPPYSISSRLIFLLLQKKFNSMTLVLQKEFALRLAAEAGSADYGRLTVAVNHKADVELLDFVPRTAFRPIPKVDSQIVRIVPKASIVPVNEVFLDQMMRYLFSQRRRALRGVLRRAAESNAKESLERIIEPKDLLKRRIFQLTPPEFENLSNLLYPQRKILKLLNK